MVSFLGHDLDGPGLGVFSTAPLATADILALDRLAVAAWPALHNDDHNGWLLRFAHGVSRRANSVAPFPLTADSISVEDQISAAEAFYQGHGLPPRLQISPAAEPAGLDQILARRGYQSEAAVTIQIAPAPVIARHATEQDAVRIETEAPDDWWDLYREGFERDARAIVAQSQEQALFATLPAPGGRPLAIGLGVMAGRWLGIFGMQTRPECRNQGFGRAVIGALAAWAVDRGVIGLYLQVEDSNPAAQRLYQRLGFQGVYGYHYRTLWTKT